MGRAERQGVGWKSIWQRGSSMRSGKEDVREARGASDTGEEGGDCSSQYDDEKPSEDLCVLRTASKA